MLLTQARSSKIKNMGIVCAMLVVFIHVPWDSTPGTLSSLIRSLTKCGISMIAVPFFFIVSGFHLSRHFGEGGWWLREIKKRIKSLMLPYFLWIAMSSTLYMFFHGGQAIGFLNFLGLDITSYPSLAPLWYLRCVFILVVLSPLLKILLANLGIYFLALLFISAITFNTLAPDPKYGSFWCKIGWHSMPPYSFLYFTLGMFLNQYSFKVRECLLLIGGVMACSVLLLKTFVFYDSVAINAAWFASIPLLLGGVWILMPSKVWPGWFTTCSFPIYITHILFITGTIYAMDRVGFHGRRGLYEWVAGISGPILFSLLARCLFPKSAAVLFGGR